MDNCYVCGSDRDPHLMMICDLCDFMVAHTTCCGFGNDFPEDWICRECENLVNGNSSEYDSDEDESYTSQVQSSSESELNGIMIELTRSNIQPSNQRRNPYTVSNVVMPRVTT